jgi:hypothetical protein
MLFVSLGSLEHKKGDVDRPEARRGEKKGRRDEDEGREEDERLTSNIGRGIHTCVFLPFTGPAVGVSCWAIEFVLGLDTSSSVECTTGGGWGSLLGWWRVDHERVEYFLHLFLSSGSKIDRDCPFVVSKSSRDHLRGV